jgi:acetyltransferase-like isoleucine patch superfamily enzyme
MKVPDILLHPLMRRCLGQNISSQLLHVANPKISPRCVVRHNVRIFQLHNVTIEQGSIVDFSCDLQAWGKIHIGKNVIISPYSVILTGSHNVQTEEYGNLIKPVFIDDYAWIAYRSIILPGVHIGKGAIVGAGSVVTKDVEAFSVVAGNPARHIKWRGVRDLNYIPAAYYIPSLALTN